MLLFLLVVLLLCPLIANRKNEILNYTEYKYYFYHRNLGHIKLGYYER